MEPKDPTRPSWEDDTQATPPEPPSAPAPWDAQAQGSPPAAAPWETPNRGTVPSGSGAGGQGGPGDAPVWPGAIPPPPPPPEETPRARPQAQPAPEPATAAMPAPPPRPPAPPAPARPPNQGTLVLGILLVLLGAGFLISRVVDLDLGAETWPLWIVAIGAALLLGSLAVRNPAGLGLAIPGGIITMVGLVLFVQETYDLYATWAYAWALVAPGGVGLGMLVHGLFTGNPEERRDGLNVTLVGLGLFVGFGLFFEGVVGLSGERIPGLGDALPYAVIVLGVVMVVAALFGGSRKRA